NISTYCKDFKQRNIIEEKGRKGKNVYLGLTKEYEPLKFLKESQKKVQDSIISQTKQLSLFQ
ncbi:MAG: hypothetical protein U1A23_01625, partial [Candidatus Sungbacteria bacterium]|nr:hypothetical protein [Candidatus Sungbacteria bacterium]